MRLRASRLGVASSGADIPLPRRVRAILNKYGATMLLPGVAEPILGPELVATLVPGSGAVLTQDANDVTAQLVGGDTFGNGNCSISVTAGKQYRIMGNIVSSTGTPNFGLSTTATGATDLLNLSSLGVKNQIYTATTTGSIFLQVGVSGANAQTFATGLSFREILGYSNTYASFQSGNYRESTGQTLAAADQQVGLVVDAARELGPELVTNGDFSNGTTGWAAVSATLSTAAGRLVLTSTVQSGGGALQAYTDIATVAGKSYLLSGSYVEQSGVASPSPRFRAITTGYSLITQTGVLSNNSVGTLVFTATATTTRVVFRCDASSLTTSSTISIDNISVRELPGIHASQSTSGFQPVVRNTAGIQSWQFDGTDDRLSLSAVPFQMADDHFVVCGSVVGSTGSVSSVFAQGHSSGSAIIAVDYSLGAPRVFWKDDSSTQATITHGTSLLNSPCVVSGRKVADSKILRVNGVQSTASVNTVLGASSFSSAVVGSRYAAGVTNLPMNGHIHGVIFGKGAISDSELLTLEKFMATLQGRTL